MHLVDYPLVFFVISVAVLTLSAWIGALLQRQELTDAQKENYGKIVGATLTLLGLIIGFSFSMAMSRYDQRKGLEEAEANAIGTEMVRAQLLPPPSAAATAARLEDYLRLRIAFYDQTDDAKLAQNAAATTSMQTTLWDTVRGPATAKPTPVTALVLAGMNDVLNSQGYTQAAWWNRIPRSAWWLMAVVAIAANVLLGYTAQPARGRSAELFILPILASIAFLLIADLDSPRGGLIHVSAQNLQSLADSLHHP
jgi:hypothetical protein